jgi:hypothetical protein
VSESVILKWTVPVDDRSHAFEWSYGATVVHVAPHPQRIDQVQVWTLSARITDPERPTETRHLRVFATGQRIPAPSTHRGTAVLPEVGLVWHVIELPGALA